MISEEKLILRLEVAEERARRDVRSVGDVFDGCRVVTLRCEEGNAYVFERLAQTLLLAFTQTGRTAHQAKGKSLLRWCNANRPRSSPYATPSYPSRNELPE